MTAVAVGLGSGSPGKADGTQPGGLAHSPFCVAVCSLCDLAFLPSPSVHSSEMDVKLACFEVAAF